MVGTKFNFSQDDTLRILEANKGKSHLTQGEIRSAINDLRQTRREAYKEELKRRQASCGKPLPDPPFVVAISDTEVSAALRQIGKFVRWQTRDDSGAAERRKEQGAVEYEIIEPFGVAKAQEIPPFHDQFETWMNENTPVLAKLKVRY